MSVGIPVYLFHSSWKEAMDRQVVAVIGLGTMGHGIAQRFAMAGHHVPPHQTSATTADHDSLFPKGGVGIEWQFVMALSLADLDLTLIAR